jgi:DNA (cytosine-5)-methyltransferase 1
MEHIDLFAGVGGFALGFERAGIQTVAHVEKDEKCRQVLRRHWPDHLILSDVCDAGGHNLPYADIITFGSPCQDLSVAGKRKGLAGERSGLFFEAARIIREIGPRYAVWENVPGALSSHNGRDFQSVLAELLGSGVPMPRSGRWATAGMVRTGQKEIAWRVLDAQYFGVAQRRRRVFLVFCPRGDSAAEVLFEREGVRRDTPPRREAGEGFAAVAGTLAANRGGTERPAGNANELDFCVPVAHQLRAQPNPSHRADSDTYIAFGGNNTSGDIEVATACNAKGGSGRMDFESETFVAFSAGNSGASYGIGASEDITPPIRAGASGTNQAPTIAFNYKECNTGEAVTPTLSGGGGGGMGDGMSAMTTAGVRRLTPTECERLQGFPDGWTDGQADSSRYRQMGNAVCVNVAEWIGRRIVTLTPGLTGG